MNKSLYKAPDISTLFVTKIVLLRSILEIYYPRNFLKSLFFWEISSFCCFSKIAHKVGISRVILKNWRYYFHQKWIKNVPNYNRISTDANLYFGMDNLWVWFLKMFVENILWNLRCVTTHAKFEIIQLIFSVFHNNFQKSYKMFFKPK